MEHSNTYVTESGDLQMTSSLIVNKKSIELKFQIKDKLPNTAQGNTRSETKIKFKSDKDILKEILEYILTELDADRETTISRTFEGDLMYQNNPSGTGETVSETSNEIDIHIGSDAVYFDTQDVAIYFNESGIAPDKSDRDLNNLESLQKSIKEMISGTKGKLDSDIQHNLRNEEYGQNVIKYLEEGDVCNSMGLNTQAILSYALAAEWAGLTYLKSERDYDLIEEEQQSGNWYSFSGKNSVLEKVSEQFKIDQTSKQLLDTVYKELRNISAHHTTGEMNNDEVELFRERVIELIIQLDSQTNQNNK